MAVFPALLLSLALLPQEAPVATTQPEQPAPAAVAPLAPPAPAAPVEQVEGAVPRGAPADDYGLVNWCWGALAGHMAVYPRVRDQLPADGYDLDEQQMAAGREYLALYERAVGAADASASASRAEAGRAARNAGQAVWAPAAGLTPTDLKWAYLGWSLPGRCETASRRLLSNAELMAPALRPSIAAAGAGMEAPAQAEAAPPQAEAATVDPAAAASDPIDPGAAAPVDPTAEPVDSTPAQPGPTAPADPTIPPR